MHKEPTGIVFNTSGELDQMAMGIQNYLADNRTVINRHEREQSPLAGLLSLIPGVPEVPKLPKSIRTAQAFKRRLEDDPSELPLQFDEAPSAAKILYNQLQHLQREKRQSSQARPTRSFSGVPTTYIPDTTIQSDEIRRVRRMVRRIGSATRDR